MPRKPKAETPLYVKLPTSSVENLQRAAQEMGVTKKAILSEMLTKYINPKEGPNAQGVVGSYSFRPFETPEVMNAEQAGQFLQISEREVLDLAEAGKLPGKRLGSAWRFSRQALVAWLSTPETR